MKNRKLKIIVDILLFITLIISIRTWDTNLTTHIIIGTLFALLMFIHIFLNRIWIVSIAKAFSKGKLNKKVKMQYIINLSLFAIWSIAIFSGILTIWFTTFSNIHGISVRLGCVFIIIHIIQHRKQIYSYIKEKNNMKKNN